MWAHSHLNKAESESEDMTREEAIDLVIKVFDTLEGECNIEYDWSKEHNARDMAIKALKQEPCEDAKPYEKFKSAKDHICKLAGDYKCWDNRLTHDEALELCKALEQDSILDKIRVEIEQIEINGHIRDIECFRAGINVALNVIDKYKAGSEV